MNVSRKALIVSLAIGLLLLPLIAMVRAHNAPPPLPTYGSLAPFSLTDQNGAPFASSSLAGHVWIADFIFTRCTIVCPRLTADMAKVQTHLVNRGLDHDARIVSFSVDPAFDSAAVLKTYAAKFGAKDGVWFFLTGAEKDVERTVVDGFKTAMSRENVNGNGKVVVGDDFDVVHGSKFVLVDQRGRIRGYYDSTDTADIAKLLHDVEGLVL